MPEIEIRFRNETEYHRLRTIRDKYGVQWRGMLIQGAKRLEGREIWFTDQKRGEASTEPSQGHGSERSHGREKRRREELTESSRHDRPGSSAEDHNPVSSLFDSRGSLRTLDTGARHERPSVDEFSPVEVER
jgi:hypothetical protein